MLSQSKGHWTKGQHKIEETQSFLDGSLVRIYYNLCMDVNSLKNTTSESAIMQASFLRGQADDLS